MSNPTEKMIEPLVDKSLEILRRIQRRDNPCEIVITEPTEISDDCVIGVDLASEPDWSPCPRCGKPLGAGHACLPSVLEKGELMHERYARLIAENSTYGKLGKTVDMSKESDDHPPEFTDAVIYDAVIYDAAKNWTPCPRCSGQCIIDHRTCTYCGGTGSCYKGEAQHA